MAESTRVRVPSQSPLSTSPNPKICYNHAINCCSARSILANHANFINSGAPDRFMYFNHDGSWIDFENEVLESLKPVFLDGKAVIEVSFGESRYLFDFTRMLQIDFDSGIQRSIAWIDVNGKCFFPKMFVREDFGDNLEDEGLNSRKIEIEINIDGNSIKRNREDFDDNDELEFSSSKKEEESGLKRQRLGMRDVGNPRWLNSRVLREEEKSYSLVKNYFLSGMKKIDPCVVIGAIHQCTRNGHLEEARQEVFQKQIEITKAARGASNTVYAWYGAPAREVESILAHGFGGPCKVSAIETYGVGVYLSPFGLPHMSAKLSEADDNGEKYIILCRVILGNVEKVAAGSRQYYPSSIDFDTGADDPKNPNWYIVWSSVMNNHIIPECVVSFKSSVNVPGQVRGSSYTKYSLEKLFSKLRSWLPPGKIREVAKLYDVYRAGKLTKNIFIRHLRCVAGDDVLLSTIREIHHEKGKDGLLCSACLCFIVCHTLSLNMLPFIYEHHFIFSKVSYIGDIVHYLRSLLCFERILNLKAGIADGTYRGLYFLPRILDLPLLVFFYLDSKIGIMLLGRRRLDKLSVLANPMAVLNGLDMQWREEVATVLQV
ncbi:unnamed protein product [Dovyalis caffra]|uniref:PARP n=1 Tax=Dovyalis caffra TaxID=77055 RepID=A0AAV1S7Q8_9ROSI|nr:unnamed protein product [Dovyalis caffra]